MGVNEVQAIFINDKISEKYISEAGVVSTPIKSRKLEFQLLILAVDKSTTKSGAVNI